LVGQATPTLALPQGGGNGTGRGWGGEGGGVGVLVEDDVAKFVLKFVEHAVELLLGQRAG